MSSVNWVFIYSGDINYMGNANANATGTQLSIMYLMTLSNIAEDD